MTHSSSNLLVKQSELATGKKAALLDDYEKTLSKIITSTQTVDKEQRESSGESTDSSETVSDDEPNKDESC